MQSDAELVRQVRTGDIESYGILVERYERLVRSIALKIARDHHLADDFVQDAFVRGLEKLGSLRDPDRFASWIVTIARQTAANAMRHRVYSPTLVGDGEDLFDNRNRLSEESEHLLELIGRLSESDQLVLALRYLNGYSSREIAAITNRRVGTVTKQLSRAYQRLRQLIQREQKNE